MVGSFLHPLHGMMTGQVVLPGRWFGDPAALGRRVRVLSVQARQASALLVLTRASVERLLKANPEFCWPLFNLLASNAQEYLLRSIDLLIQDPKLRMCSRLLTMAGRVSDYLPPSPVSLPISQEELAMTSNLSRQSVHSFLSELVQRGICELQYRDIRILDVQALAGILGDNHVAVLGGNA